MKPGAKGKRGRGRASSPVRRGFSLVEAMISVVIVGLVAAAIFGVYATGLQTLDQQAHAEVLESLARSRMELLLAVKFNFLSSGSQNVTVEGETYELTWKVSDIELISGSFGEAKKIVVTLEDIELVTIVVDPGGRVGKI